jgi:enoyl-CoA hydratase/carnithine racemase
MNAPANALTLRASSLSISDGVALFSHGHPQSRNAISLDLRMDYRDMLDHIEENPAVRALVITGSGGSFSSGGDVKSMSERFTRPDPVNSSPDGMRRRVLSSHYAWLDRLRSLELPVIAAVDGPAYGAGCSLALVADFVLASSRAQFCFAFARVGGVADFGAFYTVPRLIGLAKAKELMMTARRFDAAEAKELGLIYAVHPTEDLLEQATRLASRLSAGPREALGMIKNTLNRSFDMDYRSLAELEASQQAVALSSAYHAEAAARFTRGEPPLYDWNRAWEPQA